MSMNMPNQQPTMPVQEETMVDATVTPTGEAVQEETMTTEQPPQSEANDNQVIEAVAQGLAEDEISAEDIMVAVLSESLGLTPAGAASLFNLLMTELMSDDTAPVAETEVVDTTIQEQ